MYRLVLVYQSLIRKNMKKILLIIIENYLPKFLQLVCFIVKIISTTAIFS